MTVYFARCLGEEPIKIGLTGDRKSGWDADLERRRVGLQSQMDGPVSILAVTHGRTFVERWFHRRYAGARLPGRGELFAPCALLLADISKLQQQARLPGQPDEPNATYFRRGQARQYRLRLGVSIEELGSALGIAPKYVMQRENGAYVPLHWAIDIAGLPAAKACGLTLATILLDQDGARGRYRAHAVRSVGDGARA